MEVLKITSGFSQQSIDKILNDWTGNIIKVIIKRLAFIGEDFIVNARGNNTYKDQTGNLRSSIGYAIFYNGEQIADAFPGTDKNGLTHDEGKTKAIALAQNIADRFPNGFVLVCVAGMHYAAAVESKGFDVITNSSIIAKDDLLKAVAALNSKIEKIK